MGAAAALYRGEIRVADTDRERYLQLPVGTARHPSETPERLVLRLFALGLLGDPQSGFRAGVSAGDEPDLATRDGDGRITRWIDVGTPGLERLRGATRRGRGIAVLTHNGLLERWRRQHGGNLALAADWEVWSVDADLVDTLARGLQPRFSWDLTLSGGMLYVTADGTSLCSEFVRIVA